MVRTAVFLICLRLACICVLLAQSEQQPIVKIQGGLLEGTYFETNPNRAAFLGVPYAAPPVGELRWKPPQPLQEWNGIRKADNFGSPCPQLPAAWFPYIEGSEDCLYLNIWTDDVQPNAKRPVLVYFHGGSNTQGYSQMTPLGPPLSQLALVVVSVNYRLGPFGFLAHPALTAEPENHSSGNYGLLDQLQALRWVKENAQAFGGDPDRVTVMGQSAGAVDICLLMASPLSRGLFQRAILESGDCQDVFNEDIRQPIMYNLIDTTGEASGRRLARDLGLSKDSAVLSKLREVPASEILKAWKSDPALHFDAIVDGWVIPTQPARVFAAGKQLRIPTLVGSNANEATVFGHSGPSTVSSYKTYLRGDTASYSSQEFRLHPALSDAEVPNAWKQLQSDEFACGAFSFAQAMTDAGVNSYLYNFTYVNPGKRSRLGAHHGEELFFLGNSFPPDWTPRKEDQKLGELIRGYWAAFVKTDDPNVGDSPYWPPYDTNAKEYFELGEHLGLHPISDDTRRLETIMKHVVMQPKHH